LFQTAAITGDPGPKAVLEQPSSSRNARQTLGRRNIVLSQSDELNRHSLEEERTRLNSEQQAPQFPIVPIPRAFHTSKRRQQFALLKCREKPSRCGL
jgi:hypothetical protein